MWWPFKRKEKKQEPRALPAAAAPVRMSGGTGPDYDDNIIPMSVYLSMYNNMIPPTPPEPENRAPPEAPAHGWNGDGSYTYPDSSSCDTSSSVSDTGNSCDTGNSSSD